MKINTITIPVNDEESEESPRIGCLSPCAFYALLVIFVLLAGGLGLAGAFGLLSVRAPAAIASGGGNNHSACWMPNMDMGPDCP